MGEEAEQQQQEPSVAPQGGQVAHKSPDAVRALFGKYPQTGGKGSTVAVDRFAQQTLCWRVNGDTVAFSDRADALGAGQELDPQAIYDYLFFHVIPSPRTIFKGVRRLPPGHQGVFDGAQLQVSAYGGLNFSPIKEPSFEALKAEFRSLLSQAVQAELESQGPPACFLSGGTDSSTIAGQIAQIAGEVHTYSIGFDAAGYDEMEYARIAARHFGAKHHEYYVTPDDLVKSISQVAASYDQPFGNSSALPAYYCALRAREDGVVKLLAGDGGDELFGGNSRYATQSLYGLWPRVPAIVRKGLIEPLLAVPGADRLAVLRKGRSYVHDAKIPLPDRLHHYNLLLRLGTHEVLEPDFLSLVKPESVFEHQREVWRLANAQNDLDRMLAYDWRFTLADSDLPKVRGTAALAGVKVGYPLLNEALTDFSMKLPRAYKLRGMKLRWFFKEALRDFLPEAILKKQKKGFGLPFGVWVNQHQPLRTLAQDAVRSFATRGVVRPEFVEVLLKDHLMKHPGYYGEMVWVMMMMEHWMRKHAPDWRLPA